MRIQFVKLFIVNPLIEFSSFQVIGQRLDAVYAADQQAVMVGVATTASVDKQASDKIRALVVRAVAPIIKQQKTPPDNIDEYRNEFGNQLGPYIHGAVVKLRQAKPPQQQQQQITQQQQPRPAQLAQVPQGQRVFLMPQGHPLTPGTPTTPNRIIIQQFPQH